MKKWPRIVGLMSFIIGLPCILSACQRPNQATTRPTPTTLTMYQVGNRPRHYRQLINRANRILVKRVNAKLKITYIGWGDYSQKMSAIVASGEHYDLAKADNYTVNARSGAYADLTKLLPKYAPQAYKELDPAYLKGNLVNGKLYAMPVNGNAYATTVIAFNNRLVKKYGIDVQNVNSYATLARALKQFHQRDPQTVALAIGKGFKVETDFDYPLGNSMPFAVDVRRGGNSQRIVNQYDSSRLQTALKAVHQYYRAGYIAADATTSNTDYPISSLKWFARQETQGPYDYGDFALNKIAGQADAIVSKPITRPLKSVAQLQVFNWVVGRHSRHKRLAVQVLGLLQTDKKLLNGLVWGQAGRDYHQTGQNTITLTAHYQADNQMAPWMTGNNANLYTPTQITPGMIKQRERNLKAAASSPLLGFTPDTRSVQAEITAIQAVMERYMDGLNTGTSDPVTTIPKMDAALKRAGYQKVQRLLQQQYNQFLAKP